METIYCGIKKPEHTLAIGNAMLAGELRALVPAVIEALGGEPTQ